MAQPVHDLSPTDSLWLNMDSPENLMVIESIMWFDKPLDPERVIQQVQHRMVDRYPIFHWRPQFSPGVGRPDSWIDVPDFDIHDHVRAVTLPGNGGRAELQAFLEARMSEPLPSDRPLWVAYVLEGKDFGALVARYHHCIADGTALARVLIEITTDGPTDDLELDDVEPTESPSPEQADGSDLNPVDQTNEADAAAAPSSRPPRRKRDRAFNALSSVVTLPLAVGVKATEATTRLVRMLDLDDANSTLAAAVTQSESTASMLDKILVATPPDLLLFGLPGVPKRADWAAPYDLAEVKRAAHARGATVNDFMLGALAGALRRYLASRGERSVDVSTMIPVNLRPIDEPLPAYLGNKFALVILELPLLPDTPEQRLHQAKERMDVVKAGPEAMVTFGVSSAIGRIGTLTTRASRPLVEFLSNKAIGVTTNVPGPVQPRYLAGEELVGVLGWVPGASRQALGTCIFSYNGQIRVGFKTDARVLPDVHNLVVAFDDEMSQLLGRPGSPEPVDA